MTAVSDRTTGPAGLRDRPGVPIRLEGLTRRYGSVLALDGLDLDITGGEFLALLGPSGCGKTTALRAIAGLCRVSRGDIRFRGASLLRVAPAARPALGIALVPEGRELWAQLSVRENLELGAYARAARGRTRRAPGSRAH